MEMTTGKGYGLYLGTCVTWDIGGYQQVMSSCCVYLRVPVPFVTTRLG